MTYQVSLRVYFDADLLHQPLNDLQVATTACLKQRRASRLVCSAATTSATVTVRVTINDERALLRSRLGSP
jgi:hypothetical protein